MLDENNLEEAVLELSTGLEGSYNDFDSGWGYFNSSREKSTEVPDLLLKYGAKVNAATLKGETPLHWAVAKDSAKLVKLLLDKGADPTIKNAAGETPASYTDDEEIIQLLDPFVQR
ncbi:ankyrin repeat domain-containing protein [Cesiribacter andamanensis]|uniref:Uroporphyrinogen-III decarboxylase n=1 Tax=Cesiribacter andamanensis AMV16 TaxID=1279009 RepID=M7NHP0_9BACT|nr:ankyrin repeat domain-containing protein [Cesiribacter andamanensis]EMR01300.1 Uroporphyrinogen-III decarboxylase [Cesiribacter andamanensis AMV16]